MKHLLKVMRQEVDGVTGHITFYVRVIERDEMDKQVGEGPETPLGISQSAMDNEFGGHGSDEMLQFLASRKQAMVDAYCTVRACAEHAKNLEGREL